MIVALMPWNFFTTAVNTGTSSVYINGNILKKVYFPREIIPLSVTTSQLINFLITCLIMFVFILFSGVGFSKFILFLPLLIIIQYLLILGINLILSAVNVFVNDVTHFVQVAMTLGFYATPVVYKASMLPDKYQWVMHANPMAVLVESYRAILFYHKLPDMKLFGIWAIVSLLLLVIGYSIFKKLEKSFVEEL
jgi:ABC-2 type transport system permease protein